MAYPPHTTETTSSRTIVGSGRLWAGGIASAVVAALAGVVGFLVVRGLFGIPVLAPAADGGWGDISTTMYALSAAFAALLATGLVLILFTPAPYLLLRLDHGSGRRRGDRRAIHQRRGAECQGRHRDDQPGRRSGDLVPGGERRAHCRAPRRRGGLSAGSRKPRLSYCPRNASNVGKDGDIEWRPRSTPADIDMPSN